MATGKKYLNKTTLEAARERISMLFDNFKRINVSISSGKDSTVLFHLALQEAQKRGRTITAFFLDQEAEYQASIELIRLMMNMPNVEPMWYQVPLYMTNATSTSDYFLYAWGEGEKWMRPKEPNSVHSFDGPNPPQRFYEFFPWYEKQDTDTAYLVGLRAEESITRYRAVTKRPGWNGLRWSTLDGDVKKFYPIYDWTVYDIWKFIYDHNLPYNKIYDLMHQANYSLYKGMRVSNLIHEKSYKCLIDLPRFEPETYNALCERISGIATAARYASEKLVFSNKQLPAHYKSWQEFRDFLLDNMPNSEHQQRFRARFAKQGSTERIYRAQVGQMLIYDYENSTPIDLKASERAQEMREKWMAIL